MSESRPEGRFSGFFASGHYCEVTLGEINWICFTLEAGLGNIALMRMV